MKTKLILYSAAIAVTVGIAGWKTYGSPNSEMTQIQLENIEALTQSETYPIFIPCVQADTYCVVSILDASGKEGIMTISNSKKVAPFK